ncbi:TRAP transporter substrate-binding protein DctP [Mycolicibacterium goodii]|uniref:TRAP transporter substrate-binding protein DctP n=1 Tax=Mycolicibacterium goodii TaxID=134601 RepID=UPI001F04C32E|nr:TRAP transporter substrate-binding protein DctP [Mycolicibacterium goodii]ULN49585.1 TRAP transporter substrate-binding protein DctP [Mycolicibacterium goodii]
MFVEELRKNGPPVGLGIEYFPSSQLGKSKDATAMLTTGIADIAAVVPAYLASQMPLSSVFDLPGNTDDACIGARAVSTSVTHATTLGRTEVAKLSLTSLWSVFVPGYELMTAEDQPVREPSDIHGAILRSPGGAVDRVVHDMGAAGVSMPLGEMYEAISRGTVDGTVASPISIAPYKLSEVLRHSTIGARLGSVTGLYSMSSATFDRLTEPQRKVVRAAAAKAEAGACELLNKRLTESRDQMAADGTVLQVLSEEQQRTWTALAQPARQKWTGDLDAMGLPASEVLAEWDRTLNQEVRTHER